MGQFLPDRLFWAREDSNAPAGETESAARRGCRQHALTTRSRGADVRAQLRIAGLYAVTPDLADTPDLAARVAAALAGGAAVIQYRNKAADAALKRAQALALARVQAIRGGLYIVNDDAALGR